MATTRQNDSKAFQAMITAELARLAAIAGKTPSGHRVGL